MTPARPCPCPISIYLFIYLYQISAAISPRVETRPCCQEAPRTGRALPYCGRDERKGEGRWGSGGPTGARLATAVDPRQGCSKNQEGEKSSQEDGASPAGGPHSDPSPHLRAAPTASSHATPAAPGAPTTAGHPAVARSEAGPNAGNDEHRHPTPTPTGHGGGASTRRDRITGTPSSITVVQLAACQHLFLHTFFLSFFMSFCCFCH